MDVSLKLMGFPPLFDSEGAVRGGPLVLSVPDDATVIDLLRELAVVYGPSFDLGRHLSGTRMAGVSLFAGCEMVDDPQARVADLGPADDITVTLLRPMAGA